MRITSMVLGFVSVLFILLLWEEFRGIQQTQSIQIPYGVATTADSLKTTNTVLNPSMDRKPFSPLDKGDQLHYFKGITEPPILWNTVSFDDSSWLTGTIGIGYGGDDDNTILLDMQNNYLSVYARAEFSIPDSDQIGMLVMGIDYDDGFVAYLNGAELWRKNISGTPPAFDTPANSAHGPGVIEYFSIDPDLLLPGKNVLAVQGHNVTINSTGFSLIPTIRRDTPYLQNVTRESIIVMWQSHPATASRLRYRRAGISDWTEIHQPEIVQIHEVKIDSLDPAADYQYQVSLDGNSKWRPASPASFRTAPLASDAFRAAIYGDTRTDYEQHQAMIASMALNHPDIIFHVGDLVNNGMSYDDWGQQMFSPAAEILINTPFSPILGNHEYQGTGYFWYPDMFALPDESGTEKWYSLDYGCAHFIGLDSNEVQSGVSFVPGSEQYSWLQAELKSSAFEEAIWQFALLHHPIYSSGPHTSDETKTDQCLVPLFEQSGIDLIFSGHNHHYERSMKEGIYYIVTGGGGAPLVDFPHIDLNPYSQVRIKDYEYVTLDIDCTAGKLEYRVWGLDGETIDGPLIFTRSVPRMYLPFTFR